MIHDYQYLIKYASKNISKVYLLFYPKKSKEENFSQENYASKLGYEF